eukprot:15478308-Alexandrium_andersonii.AAC.1
MEWPAAAAPRLPRRQAERGVATSRPPAEGGRGAPSADSRLMLWRAGRESPAGGAEKVRGGGGLDPAP